MSSVVVEIARDGYVRLVPGGRAYCTKQTERIAMGLIRKAASISSLGAVNYRSKGDRKVKVLESDSKANQAAEKQRLSIERQRAQAEMIQARAIAAQAEVVTPTLNERLARTQRLLESGFISREEYDRKRAEILSEI